MAKKLYARGRHTVLPIVGDTLIELDLGIRRLASLVFKAAEGDESELTIEDQICLRRGESERILAGSKPGVTFDPKGLSPLLELLGSQVRDAVAEKEGRLRVVFSNELVLEVTSSTGYEAWHFQYPRPGRPVSGKVDHSVSVTGAYGYLIF